MQATLAAAFAAIAERHLQNPPPADLSLWWLRGAIAGDPRLSARIGRGRLELLLAGRDVASAAAPASPEAAAAALARLAAEAVRQSQTLRRAGAEAMVSAGFDEMFAALDPFSRYLTAEQARAARAERVGQAGLGLRIGPGPGGRPAVTLVEPGGPAALAGIRVGDALLSVDGVPLGASDLPLAALLLEGPPGTAASLRLSRAGRSMTVEVPRTRRGPPTVSAERRAEGVLWLRLSAFAADTAAQVEAALADPRGTAIVLDLRGNRGGLLSEALAVADALLSAGRIGATTGRHPDATRTWEADGPELGRGRPVVVLVDGRTASAAEVLAAALADGGRGALVGSGTQGKGLIQMVVPLPGGAELLLSWSRLLGPRGTPIQDVGVIPSLCTALGEAEARRALAMLAQGGAPMRPVLDRAARLPPEPRWEEARAIRAACPPAEGRALDEAMAAALLADPVAYRAALAR
ncbi:MAG: S41 family peptidase [Acetobacteraceae bacterium]|nr:S41 family peptidase [Acetobacteraceae bacterium]MCX7684627.1 S41 family peptidase [Acetobacteraceae bacterium]MDW8398537.1 S41 family peptidase [Acetobacteraceae bacterium]